MDSFGRTQNCNQFISSRLQARLGGAMMNRTIEFRFRFVAIEAFFEIILPYRRNSYLFDSLALDTVLRIK